MPLLLRPSPVAGRALAWRGSGRDTAALTASRSLVPLAAVRHLFRDHYTSGPHDGQGSHDNSHHHGPHHQHHQHHPHHHRRHPNHRTAPELSSDWPSLYLAGKLALWSGLCYFPYETIPRTLQEEGLKLVAYGRTSYTCWYVADGCVDFEALPRRAFPRKQTQPSQQLPPQEGRSAAGSDDDLHSSSGGGGDANGGSERSAAVGGPEGGQPASFGAADGGHGASGGGGAVAAVAASSSTNGGAHASGQTHRSHDHVHANSRTHHRGHTDGHLHLHLHREQPALHLRVGPGAERGPPHPGGAGNGGTAGSGADGGTAPPLAPVRQQGPTAAVTPGTRCRFIFLRGVQWAAHDANTLSLSASLAAFWPSPLLPPDAAAADGAAAGAAATVAAGAAQAQASAGSGDSSSSSPSSPSKEHLVAHSGVAALARELLPVLLPHIREAAAAGAEHVVFAGHSLGGSLAKLLWAMSIQQGHRSPDATSCHTFGSPPVLAHAGGGGGGRVLRLLRAPPSAAVNWVLEHDPVPRALLTADPYFAAVRRAVPGLGALLALRGAVLGEGAALSSGRFLYETVGELLLLRWSTRGGCEAVPVSEAEAESLLQMAMDEAVAAPVRSLQYWLDHHHASYHHDLETAALTVFRRQARSQQQQRHPQHPHQQQLQQQQQEQEQQGEQDPLRQS